MSYLPRLSLSKRILKFINTFKRNPLSWSSSSLSKTNRPLAVVLLTPYQYNYSSLDHGLSRIMSSCTHSVPSLSPSLSQTDFSCAHICNNGLFGDYINFTEDYLVEVSKRIKEEFRLPATPLHHQSFLRNERSCRFSR